MVAQRDVPIRRKLMRIILLTSGMALLFTCAAFLGYEYVTFRQTAVRELTTVGKIIAANSTAALAFQNRDDALGVMAALRSEPNIRAAALYDAGGRVFAVYPESAAPVDVPAAPNGSGYRFSGALLEGFEPVVEGDRRLGTLYLQSHLAALGERLRLYAAIALAVMAASLLAAYVIARRLQRQVSDPIVALADTATAISEGGDFSVRATGAGADEVGRLTEAFNRMLDRVDEGDHRLRAQLARLDLLSRITRAIGERQDLPSIFQVVITTLEDNLPIAFGCICRYNPVSQELTVAGVGNRGRELAAAMGIAEQTRIPIDRNGLSRCLRGQVVYESDTAEVASPFPARLAAQGLRSLVAAPLLLESQVFGVLLAARHEPDGFSSPDCEFLRQLSEHVALAAQQVQIYGALQQAYDDLRQSQQTMLQHERLRALGEMASGIAHDINNAVSPVALYTQMLLESEPNLSPTARDALETIDRAIVDVAATVARMREFYRPRNPQLSLAPTDLNAIVGQVLNLTRARWSDMPQQRGVVIRTVTDLAPDIPTIAGAEHELREALTNLVFNAVDAMPEGGTLTIRTRVAAGPAEGGNAVRHAHLEVADTGRGMEEETRRRCFEPFFTTKGERGTGLGLAMVYGIVRRHSADIEIESAPDQGTTVRISFAVPGTALEAQAPERTVVVAVPSRLLLVDDDPLLLKSLREILETYGHRVTSAGGGREGIETFQEALVGSEPFAAVITDLGMPYVDGRQVARAVKEASPTTPVLMLTGWGQRMTEDGDLPDHVDRVLSKPPRLRELNAALVDYLAPRV